MSSDVPNRQAGPANNARVSDFDWLDILAILSVDWEPDVGLLLGVDSSALDPLRSFARRKLTELDVDHDRDEYQRAPELADAVQRQAGEYAFGRLQASVVLMAEWKQHHAMASLWESILIPYLDPESVSVIPPEVPLPKSTFDRARATLRAAHLPLRSDDHPRPKDEPWTWQLESLEPFEIEAQSLLDDYIQARVNATVLSIVVRPLGGRRRQALLDWAVVHAPRFYWSEPIYVPSLPVLDWHSSEPFQPRSPEPS